MKILAVLATVELLASVVNAIPTGRCYVLMPNCNGPYFKVSSTEQCCTRSGKSYELPPPAIGCVRCRRSEVIAQQKHIHTTCYGEMDCQGWDYVLPPGTPPRECCRYGLSYRTGFDPCTTCIYKKTNYRFGRLY